MSDAPPAGAPPSDALPAPGAICTFHKCGSNWFRWIFWHLAAHLNRAYQPHPERPDSRGITRAVPRPGAPIHVFPGGNRDRLAAALGPAAAETAPVILCLRDPRDALISQYFSWRYSHANNTPKILAVRARLDALPLRDGLQLLIAERHLACATQLTPWLPRLAAGSATVLRYEGLTAAFVDHLGDGLRQAGLSLAPEALAAIAEATAFERLTGRARGEARAHEHYRKGIVGDHRNHLDAGLLAEYEAAYGALTQRLGYS